MKRKRKHPVPLARVPVFAIAVPGYCAICGMESEEVHPSCAEWLGPYYIPSKAAMDLSTLRYSGVTMAEALENLEAALAGPYRVYNMGPSTLEKGSTKRSLVELEAEIKRVEARLKQQETYLGQIELGFKRYYARSSYFRRHYSFWDSGT